MACRKHSGSRAPPRGYTVAMRRSRYLRLAPLTLALMLSACGNKGDLVKPNPAAVPPKTDQPAQAPTGETPPPQESSGGH